MADFKTITIPWTTLFSDLNTSNGLFNACTGWMNAADVDVVQIAFEVQNSTDASGVIKPGFQTCNVENSLDSPSTIASVNTCTGNDWCPMAPCAIRDADRESKVPTPKFSVCRRAARGPRRLWSKRRGRAGSVFDISATTNTKQLVRFGFYFLTSAASLKCARVTAKWQVKKS